MLIPRIGPRGTVLGALCVAVGCTTSATCDCIGDPRLDVVALSDGFLVHNRSDVWEMTVTVAVANSLALIDGACETWTPRIAPDGELHVTHDQVIAYTEGAEQAVVWWCTLDGTTVTDSGVLELPFS